MAARKERANGRSFISAPWYWRAGSERLKGRKAERLEGKPGSFVLSAFQPFSLEARSPSPYASNMPCSTERRGGDAAEFCPAVRTGCPPGLSSEGDGSPDLPRSPRHDSLRAAGRGGHAPVLHG